MFDHLSLKLKCKLHEATDHIFFNRCTPSDQQKCLLCSSCSVTKSYSTLCNPMDCSMPGFPVLHYLSEFAQIPLHWWCHPAISPSVAPSSSCLQSFLASLSFPMGWLFISGAQNIGASATASVQFSSVPQACPTLCNPMDCSTPGLPVHHQLPEFTQTCVHQVGGAIQPPHPLSFPSPPALSLSQHQGLFK